MKKLITKIAIPIISLMMLGSCTDDFTELNTDPKNFTQDAVSQSDYPLFVKTALYTPTYNYPDGAGPFQLGHSLFPDIYANYFATTAANFDSDQFILVGSWLDGSYNWFYSNAAPNIKVAEDLATDLGFELENAIMKTWRVYAYHRMTDLWGPIPYSQYGNLETSVPYDSQEAIYNDFFTTLDEAVAVMKANAGKTSFLGENDIIYGGSVDAWLKFASTLRLRLAMRVKYVDPAKSQSEAEKAVADGVMLSNDDNATISTTINFPNYYNTITQWGEFRMSADMESILKGYEDPRVGSYFAEAAEPDDSDDPAGLTFNWEGIRNGQLKADKQGIDFNSLASNMAEPYTLAGAAGPNWPIIRSAEAYFLRAEGALEGWAMGGTAKELYNQGIVASQTELGYDGNDLAGNDYVTSTNMPVSFDGTESPVSGIPISYNATGSSEEQLEQIITQKWIALYPDSEEAYAERRRTGYPTLYNRLNSLNAKISVDQLPRRVPYVSSEYSTNKQAVNDAVNNLLGGPDDGTTKLWWDAKN